MRAAFYERNGAASAVLTVGTVDTPEPGAGAGEQLRFTIACWVERNG